MNHIKKILLGVLLFFVGFSFVYASTVSIDSVKVKEKGGSIEVSSPKINDNTINSTIKFKEVDDFVVLEVKLDAEEDIVITGVSDNNDSEFIKSSYEFEDLKFYLTLKYKNELSDDDELDLDDISITVNFSDGSSHQVNPNKDKKDNKDNPGTGDGILKTVIIFVVSIVGLCLAFKLVKKHVKLVLVLFVLLPVIILASDSFKKVYVLSSSKISVAKKLTITYEANGGEGIDANVKITAGEPIGTLPTPEKENYVLEGWYSDSELNNKIDETFVPTASSKIYAKWLKSINGSLVSPLSMVLIREGTDLITVTNVEEGYTFISNDTSVAEVDQNGVVTAVGAGTTTITVKGKKSNETKTVNVTVNPKKYTISFNGNGGTAEPTSKDIDEGTELGELPTLTREDYLSDGLYTAAEGGSKVTTTTVPAGSVEYFAHWTAKITLATVTSEINVNAGSSKTISVSGPEGMEDYEFISNDESVATVTNTGVVTGVANGTTSITVKGKRSNATKTVTVTVTEIQPIEYKTRKTAGKISLGDVVALAGEDFYVVSTNGDKTALLAKYNLKVGENYTFASATTYTHDGAIAINEDGYGLQSSTTKGYVSGGTGTKYLGVVAFSGTNYWDNKHCDYDVTDYICSSASSSLAPGFTGNYNGIPSVNVYRSSMNGAAPIYEYHNNGFGLAQSNGYTIAYYVEAYVNKLKELGAPNTITGRLLITEEAQALGCSTQDYECTNDDYSWVYSSSYWTGSASSYGVIRYINTLGFFEQVNFAHTVNLGVRPVIEVNTSELIEDDEVIVKFNANGGSVSPSYVIAKSGESIGTLPTPTHSDSTYTFNGWYTSLDSSIALDNTYTPNANVELVAKWDVAATSAFNFENQKTPGTISIGDEISIGSEHFYVVSTNNSKTAMLAKYNLYVGDIMASDLKSHTTIESTDEGYGLQNSTALGAGVGAQNVGTVSFSGSKYWSGSNNDDIYDSERVGAPDYIYINPYTNEHTNGTAQNTNYSIAYYVEPYVAKLKTLGAPDTITGRLLKLSEAESLGCEQEDMCYNSNYSWVYSTSYWLGSGGPSATVDYAWIIHKSNMVDYNKATKNDQYGVRPVIVVNTSDILGE